MANMEREVPVSAARTRRISSDYATREMSDGSTSTYGYRADRDMSKRRGSIWARTCSYVCSITQSNADAGANTARPGGPFAGNSHLRRIMQLSQRHIGVVRTLSVG